MPASQSGLQRCERALNPPPFVGVEFSPVLSCRPAPKGISRGVSKHHRRQCFSPDPCPSGVSDTNT